MKFDEIQRLTESLLIQQNLTKKKKSPDKLNFGNGWMRELQYHSQTSQ